MSTPTTDLDSPDPADTEGLPQSRPTPRASRNGTPPTREPPHSAEAEEHVLACCLLEGDNGLTLQRAKDAGLTPQSFYFPANRLIFEVASSLTNPDLPLLVAELQTRRQLEAVGGMPYLMQITGGVPTTAHAGYFIEKVREKEILRELIKTSTRTVEEAYSFTGGLDELLELTRLRTAALTDRKATKTPDPETRRVRLTTPPKEPTTRLFLAGKPIATPGNLVTIISRAKTGKTAALGGAVAAIVAAHHDRSDQDTLGFTAPHTTEAVILIDTEQAPYDAWTCHERTMARAGQTDDPAWLHHYALVGYGARQLRDTLPKIIERAKAAHQGIFTIILDGVADFVSSVNDEVDCNECIAWLQSLAVAHDCPIICVIHSNEAIKSGDDGRGHLGKQLTRKAESNLLLKKNGEITTITSEKQRKAPITEKDGVAFQWSDEHQRHVSCEPASIGEGKMGGRPKAFTFDLFTSIFPRTVETALTKNQLLKYAADIAPIKETAFREILHSATENGTLTRTKRSTGFYYHLSVPGA